MNCKLFWVFRINSLGNILPACSELESRKADRPVQKSGDYLAKRSKMSTSSERRWLFSGSPLAMPSGTHVPT